jgi:hypothetical protein
MTVQSTARTAAGSQHHTAGAPLAIGATAAGTAAADRPMAGTTRTAAGVRGRALLAALGLALAAAVLPATAVHASPQSPGVDNQFANPGGNPQPPEPPDPPHWGGPDDLANPTEDPDPPVPPTPDPDSTDGDSIPTPQRVDAGFGGAAVGAHQFAGLALIAAALALTLLVIVIARRHRAEARSAR